MYEVEQKFRVENLDQIRIALLKRFAGQVKSTVWQCDHYLAHPSRDFFKTNEALRIRHVKTEDGEEQIAITYKGPRLERDESSAEFKTRKEIEVLVTNDGDAADRLQAMFDSLGFQRITAVIKTRQRISTSYLEWPIEFALDQLEGLGTFLEIETVSEEDKIDAAQDVVRRISQELGLKEAITCSYLDMLLAKNSQAKGP